jgi:hypothetical protein
MSPIDERLNTLGIGLPDVMPPVVADNLNIVRKWQYYGDNNEFV